MKKHKPVLGVLSAALMTVAGMALNPAAGLAAAAQPPSQPDTVQRLIAAAAKEGPQRVIVQLKERSDQDRVLGSLRSAQAGVKTHRKFDRFPMLALEADSKALEQLAKSDRVVRIQPDTADLPTLGSTIPLINADDVHGFGFTGTGFAVAILDTGIDRDHPFLAGRIVEEACFSSSGDGQQTLCPNGNNEQTGAGAADVEIANCMDGGSNICDHGSHVAGIAAGSAAGVTGAPGNGVAPGATIIAIQVFTRFDNADDCDGNAPCVRTFTSDQIAGLEHVLDLSDDHNIAAANMSLGGGEFTSNCDDDSRKDVIDDLLAEGIPTVIAAGNDGFGAAVSAPGCISTAVTVGATTDGDAVAGFSNRGTLLDLFAPGVSVRSSVPDDTWANFDGTSMAAPHVAGAFALLRQARPGETAGQLLTRLRDTGVPITYNSGGNNVTTPRIDLLNTVPVPPPTADAGGPYSTVEGSAITLAGSGTNATSFAWDFDGDGAFDDATGPTPTFGLVGQDGVFTVRLRVTGPGGTATDDATVTVANVAPQVVATLAPGPRREGTAITLRGTIVDPGWLDPLTATINWGDGTSQPASGVLENDPPNATLTFTADKVYGDNGTFTITVCGFDDDTSRCGSTNVTIANIDPTAAIDKSGAVATPGGQTIVTDAHDELALSGRVTDPGSDDLIITWDFGDGGASPDKSTTSLVNPPNPDPPLSPSVQPRDVTDNATVEYRKACVYEVTFAARDDDGGTGSDGVTVVVQDNGVLSKISTLWYLEFLVTTLPPDHFPDDVLQCYLDIAQHMSGVFGEATDASTIAAARDVVAPRLLPTARQQFDREALTAWLNFAHGAFGLNDGVDTDCNLSADDTFINVMRNAEAVRLDPAASDSAIRAHAALLGRLNLCNPL
ncbi:S8 family peptidase [Allorhizocola rhizosphaerae]|uniref:S8 family peptidase n=1 Tax=Allorhizocola rhizosphaerae TaxID=1872709 RepID=UPI0013C31711|nr:S8 family serine peptidase [Allorhizocola rhizosphaerae]